jgi:hypothetical protein
MNRSEVFKDHATPDVVGGFGWGPRTHDAAAMRTAMQARVSCSDIQISFSDIPHVSFRGGGGGGGGGGGRWAPGCRQCGLS